MAVDEKTVRRIAHLARLKLPDDQVAVMQKEINGILGWIEQLQQVDVSGVEPMTSVTPMSLRWRADVIDDGGVQDQVLKNAPQAEFGFYAVPKVIE
jgi:aspartyl-tRNA(Asn)/glutamyl-tRNA(Gln) amidotransferase subunit C